MPCLKRLKRLIPPCVVLVLCALGALLPAAPSTGTAPAAPAAPPASRGAIPQASNNELQQLARRAGEALRAKRYDEAETVYLQILKLVPDGVNSLYNMACVQALKGNEDSALDYLEQAFKAGYSNFNHMQRDKDLESLRELPRYKGLLEKKEEFYKLAGQRTLAKLKNRFGEGYLYAVDDENKLIFATNSDQPTLELLKRSLLKQARSQWQTVFENKPEEYIAVILPTGADYKKMQPNPSIKGVYYHESRTLISESMGTVMTHEFTHAMHCGDISRLGQSHPVWLMEGMAVLFESASYEGEMLVPRDNWRFPSVQGAVKRGRHVPLDRMCKMPQPEFMKQAGLLYGQAGCVMMYFHDQKLLKKFFKTYKETYAKDKSGILAMETVCGKKITQIESDWKAWVLKRSVPLVGRGQDTGALGATFAQAEEGVRVERLVPDGAADKAGVEVGDIVLAIDGQEPKDTNSAIAMLKNFRVGELIKLKVHRGEDITQEIEVKLGARK